VSRVTPLTASLSSSRVARSFVSIADIVTMIQIHW
jgi:hypothetical protein